jgi:hypothetical protein
MCSRPAFALGAAVVRSSLIKASELERRIAEMETVLRAVISTPDCSHDFPPGYEAYRPLCYALGEVLWPSILPESTKILI